MALAVQSVLSHRHQIKVFLVGCGSGLGSSSGHAESDKQVGVLKVVLDL